MFDTFDAAFIDSLDLMQDVPNSTGEEMVEAGLLPMKSRETTELDWTKDYHERQEQHLAMENKVAKAKKKQREERMLLKRIAVAAVRRRVRLEGGDEEAEEVQVEGEEMEGMVAKEGQGPLKEGQGWSYIDYLRFAQGRE